MAGATVELRINGVLLDGGATTDAYGDFKVDGIDSPVGTFTLAVRHAAFGVAQLCGEFNGSLYVGTLVLAAGTV